MPIETTDPTEVPALPQLEPGITLLKRRGQTKGALHSLVLDHLLLSGNEAQWIDAQNNATTTLFAKIAPSQRVLDRVNVARGFTAFQHYSLVEALPETLTNHTSLVVVPSVDWFYDSDDLCRGEGEEMLTDALEILDEVAAANNLPVLLTRNSKHGVGERIDGYYSAELECVETRFGPRFTGEDVETLVFECHGGVQTTFAFWRRVLEQRHASVATEQEPGVPSVGTN